MDEPTHTNHLARETSPYLLQHAHNPVEWYPWGAEALDKARAYDLPILLSVGYSACHWCHVMAHESFEDQETAELMNRHFINIKVDREERPDLDKIYQLAHQLLAKRPGGWPLTVLLSPDNHIPFFAGTYFPKEPRFNMPAFKDILTRIAEFYHQDRDELRRQNTHLLEALNSLQPAPAANIEELLPTPLDLARSRLGAAYDDRLGGFGSAPKFPHPASIARLLRHYAATTAYGHTDRDALHMAQFTLKQMALGGIYDQLGGGFCRYSVDDRWMIPHFEKMLYDNGSLLTLYAESWQIEHQELFKRTVDDTAGWVMREMQTDAGGYCSSLDADSEGVEGKYYVWTQDQVKTLLDQAEYTVIARHLGFDRGANFEGNWHLHVYRERDAVATDLGLTPDETNALIDSACSKLLQERESRIRPRRDDKILTSWNALMIKGMAVAGRVFARTDWIDSAEQSLDFIKQTLWRDGRLLATCKDGKAHLNAYLDDHTFLIDAILELLQARWRSNDLGFAIDLADTLLEQFQDPDQGGFYFTSRDHETLIQRPKPFGDDSIPSGNGVAAHALLRLGHLLGETRYLDAAEHTLRASWPAIAQLPEAHNTLLLALEEYLYPTQTIVIRGEGKALTEWQQCTAGDYAPRRFTVAIPAAAGQLPGLLAERTAQADTVAYICSGHTCQAPVTALKDFKQALAPLCNMQVKN